MSSHTDRPLVGRVPWVAGATRGAGRAIAVELARAGTHVYALRMGVDGSQPDCWRLIADHGIGADDADVDMANYR